MLTEIIAKAMEEKGHLTPEEYKKISIDSAKQVGRAIFFSELIIISFISSGISA